MASFYQSLLGIALAVIALTVGLVAAVHQLLATQVSQSVARLLLRSPVLWIGFLVTAISVTLAAAGALLLAAPHDLVKPDLSSNKLLGNVVSGLICLVALAVGGGLTAGAAIRALRLLDLGLAADELARRMSTDAIAAWVIAKRAPVELAHGDVEAARRGSPIDPIAAQLWLTQVNRATPRSELPAAEPAERDLLEELRRRKGDREREVIRLRRSAESGALADAVLPLVEMLDAGARAGRTDVIERAAHSLVEWRVGRREHKFHVEPSEVEELAASEVVDRLESLARRWADRGDTIAVAALCDAVTSAGGRTPVWSTASLGLVVNASQALLARRAAVELCAVIRDLAVIALRAVEERAEGAEELFDEACRALGNLGEKIPSTFHSPSDPEVTLIPHSLRYEVPDPLGCLLDALAEIRTRLFAADEVAIGPLVWRDAIGVTTQAIADRASNVYKDSRLEHQLVSAMLLLARLGTEGARRGDAHRAMLAAFELANLAENADRPFYHEYPTDIVFALAEIGLFSEVHDLTSPDGSPLAGQVAEVLSAKFSGYLRHPMREVLMAGRFSPAAADARWTFIKRVGVVARDNFGLNFDPVTGADGPTAP